MPQTACLASKFLLVNIGRKTDLRHWKLETECVISGVWISNSPMSCGLHPYSQFLVSLIEFRATLNLVGLLPSVLLQASKLKGKSESLQLFSLIEELCKEISLTSFVQGSWASQGPGLGKTTLCKSRNNRVQCIKLWFIRSALIQRIITVLTLMLFFGS